MLPDIGDIIELITSIPEKNLNAGLCGTVVHSHSNDIYEIEFTNEKGETMDFLSLHKKYFMVVWKSETKQWIPIAEQTSSLVAGMPDDVARQVLDFARFLSFRYRKTA
ncbi:conserved hypothetical protein [Desulfamplus magnetovallimortis]|uniref:DUF4926 domain-containing protein n=1 Tax=Desulfamplus magnetovallimortis TaxID=1246637 RepID=A0A1W1HBK9_9BACT|nr:DUF4926 domain-containing protein [Desulfamplus magnetovallimortis]SLM29877.1 conserved hypothetical protein [Desulfamplus magnetovallimortis]